MARTKKATRAVGYVRISNETDDTLSPITQRKRIRDLVASRGWTLVDVVEDIDESAYNGRRRPGLETIMSRLGEIDVVVFARLDRLTRTPSESLSIAERCKAQNVALVSCDAGEIDTASAEGEFQFGLLVGLYRREVRVLSERTSAGVQTAREKGHHLGRVPFGWKAVDKKLVPDKAQQAVLRDVAKRYVAGESWLSIADTHGMNSGPLQRLMSSERVMEALPAALAMDLAAAMNQRKWIRAPLSKLSLLGGIATCAVCGGSMTRSSTRGGRDVMAGWGQYRCAQRGHAGISARFLDDHVSTRIVEMIDTTKLAAAIKSRRKSGTSVKTADIEARMHVLAEMFADGKVTASQFETANGKLVEKLAAAKTDARRNGAPDLPLELARDLAKRWDELSVPARRSIIAAVLERIEVDRAMGHGPISEGRVRLVWR